jgi:hypothetical protein
MQVVGRLPLAGVKSLGALHGCKDAATAVCAVAANDGVAFHEGFLSRLLSAAAELNAHAEPESRIGAGAATSRPPSAAAIMLHARAAAHHRKHVGPRSSALCLGHVQTLRHQQRARDA